MLATALIVFRESLEASLFIGIVAAATQGVARRSRWLGGGVAAGVLGSLVLALAASHLDTWLDGVGQDVVNIVALSLALAMLLWHCIWLNAHTREMASAARMLGTSVSRGQRAPWALSVAIALAVLREGAETVLFVGGTMSSGAHATSGVVLAVLLGIGAGVLAGTVLYAGLARIPLRHVFAVTNALIALLAGSLASQLARLLAQAGFLDVGTNPLWDTSAWLAAESPLGVLLHALAGYDAQPSAAQVTAYVGALVIIVVGTRWMNQRTARAMPNHATA